MISWNVSVEKTCIKSRDSLVLKKWKLRYIFAKNVEGGKCMSDYVARMIVIGFGFLAIILVLLSAKSTNETLRFITNMALSLEAVLILIASYSGIFAR